MSDASPQLPADRPEKPTSPPRRRLLRIVVFGGLAALAIALVSPGLPHAQHLRLHLGPGSTRVVRATARVGREGAWDRESTWRFEAGAPPAIAWSFELANGRTEVEVELASRADSTSKSVQLVLAGDELEVELADVTRALP